jgi:predicted dehydrogenase
LFALRRSGTLTPRAIFIACPPQYRGGLQTGLNDLELQINKHFPDAAIMLEKPVATGLPWAESVGNAHSVGHILETHHNGVVSVGYCLRYLSAVQEMKRIIDEKGLHV